LVSVLLCLSALWTSCAPVLSVVALVVMRPLSLAAHLRGISLGYGQHSSVK
jgi:hypothetical protein